MGGKSPVTCLTENRPFSRDFYTRLGQRHFPGDLQVVDLGNDSSNQPGNITHATTSSEGKGKGREKAVCSGGRVNKCMLDAMTAFVTCFSQQCLAPVGCSTEGIGCTEPRPCLAQPKEFCLVTRQVPQAHGTHLASFPRPRRGTENFPQGHYRTFSSPCCHWLASSDKQLSPHFMLCCAFKPAKPRFSKDPQGPRNRSSSIYFRRIRHHGFLLICACCLPCSPPPSPSSMRLPRLSLNPAL